MKQEEWLAEFERIHGRPASQEEYQQAWGLFRNPETSQGTVDGNPSPQVHAPTDVSDSRMGQAVPPVASQPQGGLNQEQAVFPASNGQQVQVTSFPNGQVNGAMAYPGMGSIAPKKSKKGLIIGICSLLAVASLAVGAFFLFFKNPNSIQGTWQATSETKKELLSYVGKGFLDDTAIPEEYMKDLNVSLEVKDKKVKMVATAKIDFKALADYMVEGSGGVIASSSDALNYIETYGNSLLFDQIGIKIDTKKGTIEYMMFQGKLNEKDKEFVSEKDTALVNVTLDYTTKDGILTIKEKDGKGDEKLTFKK